MTSENSSQTDGSEPGVENSEPPPSPNAATGRYGETEAFLTGIDKALDQALQSIDEMLRIPVRTSFSEIPYIEHLREVWSERHVNESDPVWLWVEVVSLQDQRYREHLAKLSEVISKQAEILTMTIRYLRVQVARIEEIQVDSDEMLKVSTETVDLLHRFGESGGSMVEGMDKVVDDAATVMEDHKKVGKKIIVAADNIAGVSLRSVYVYGFGLAAAVVCGFIAGRYFS